MKDRHGNGNGHGKSLEIEAQRLLPTPTSGDSVGIGYATDVSQLTKADQPHRLRDAVNAISLLPTPAVNDMGAGKTPEAWDEWTADGKSLAIEAQRLLPTPKASDGPNGGPGMRNGRGEADALPGVVTLLPTPVSRDWKGRDQTDSDSCLPSVAPRVTTDFGPYAAAIHRWEQVLGRPAPPPTEPGQNGRPRLSPRFVEFMMGLPDGWVTGVDIPRSAQLKALGNGVVPQQCALALSVLSPRLAGAA